MLKNGPEVTQDMAQGRGLFTGTTVEVRARVDKAQGPDAAKPIPLDVLEKLKKSTVIESAIKIVADNYPEMRWLTGDVHATPEGIVAATQGRSISEKLFGANHIEFNRTAVGIMTLLWVLNDDYESFTASQNPAVRLTRKSFEELRAYTEHILNNKPEALDAMITYMLTFDALIAYTVINDLGKIESVVEMVKKESGVEEVDHDKILAIALEHHPEISTSFNRLADGYKRMILTGLKANFNFGQFIQGENVPASLSGLIGLDKEAFDFYMLHVIYDIAGAAGHVKEAGSLIVTEPTYQGFKQGIDALDKLNAGASMVTAYDDFLEAKGAGLGLDVHTPVERAVIRLCAMLRITDKEKARQVLEALDLLAPNERVILEKELNITGVDDGYATLLYYAPATLANLITALEKAGDPQPFAGALRMGLRAFARTFQLARIALKGRSGNGVFIVNISKLAEAAKMPQEFETAAIDLQTVGRDVDALVTQPTVIDVSKFPRLGALAEIPGQKVIPIGIGGGSDVIQAAVLGDLLEKAGKTVPAIISVRTVKIGSQGVVGEIGGQRTIQGHGGEIAPGVYKILPTTTGSGRFLENLPSSSVPVFLVLDAEDGTLTEKIKAVVTHVGGADTVVSVDTGGDALHMTGGTSDVARATPDQDLRVLLALNDIGTPVVTAEVATGVDSPRYAQQVLGKANARFYQLSDIEKERVFAKYRDWQMDGAPDGIKKGNYGKTPFAWQKALHGATGWQCLPLPEGIVLDNKNPWDPFVFISKSVEGIFFMDLKDHLKAIQDKALDAAMSEEPVEGVFQDALSAWDRIVDLYHAVPGERGVDLIVVIPASTYNEKPIGQQYRLAHGDIIVPGAANAIDYGGWGSLSVLKGKSNQHPTVVESTRGLPQGATFRLFVDVFGDGRKTAKIVAVGPGETLKTDVVPAKAKDDGAQLPPGGIDLNARHMGLDVARDGKGVEMELDPAMIADFQRGDFSGVVPFIIRIIPVQDPLARPAA